MKYSVLILVVLIASIHPGMKACAIPIPPQLLQPSSGAVGSEQAASGDDDEPAAMQIHSREARMIDSPRPATRKYCIFQPMPRGSTAAARCDSDLLALWVRMRLGLAARVLSR